MQTSGGTLDVLMEAGWVKIAGRRDAPGRPTIYATTPEFLDHFGLTSRGDLPGIAELRATGLLDPVEDAFESLMGSGDTEGSDNDDRDDKDGSQTETQPLEVSDENEDAGS